ncbi:MAG: DUF2339 domain-containing protein [Bacteroidetes bacterium]|nr:DUF2339 domain-containing protein [Bacteroidota bacterium]
MDVLAVILLIVLFFVLLSFRISVSSKLQRLEQELGRLRDQLSKATLPQRPSDKAAPPPVVPPAAPPVTKQTEEEERLREKFRTYEQDASPARGEPATAGPHEAPVQKGPVQLPPRPVPQQRVAPPSPPKPPEPSFFERHPDLEKFIGENLISKIGIAILVLAVGFFVKYAIDNDWIKPVGRVGIGILCGGILVGLAHRLHKNYKAFSSVLVGGGLAIFYFTITLAYHQFHLLDQVPSFIIMVVITIFAVVLSLLYDRQELAIIALVGGFTAPFLVSDGSNNYRALFSYLLVLNAGLLFIAYNKAWRLLNFLSFVLTAILMASWIATLPFNAPADSYRNGFLFAAAFYLMFFGINIAHNIRENRRFIASDFGILLANTALFFSAGLYFIYKLHADNYRGIFTAGMGVFNLAASFILFRRQKVDRNVLYLLTGITLTFVSLTAPVQLHGNYITLFWASECVLLYWLYQRSRIGVILVASYVIWGAMLVSLLMDWANIYSNPLKWLPILFNKGFITTLYAGAATYLLYLLHDRKTEEKSAEGGLIPWKSIFRIGGLALAFIAGALEINHQFVYYYPDMQLNILYLMLYGFAFIVLFQLVHSRRSPESWIIRMVGLLLCLLVYLCMVQEPVSLLQAMLLQHKNLPHFTAHWITALLALVIYYFAVMLVRKVLKKKEQPGPAGWLLCAWFVVFVSAEASLIVHRIYYTGPWEHIGDVFVKTGLPILWGLCSFAFMWLGMKYKVRQLRIISLTLFLITLVKLFAYDIRNIPVGGKIAAFFCLGVLLLVVSFMYQRLKRIIIEDGTKKTE